MRAALRTRTFARPIVLGLRAQANRGVIVRNYQTRVAFPTFSCRTQLPTNSFSGKLVRAFATATTVRSLKYSEVTVGCPKEIFEAEKRVAVTPENVQLLRKSGFKAVLIEKGAGVGANFSDAEYEAAGATLVDKVQAMNADVVLKLRPPTEAEANMVAQNKVYIGFIYDAENQAAVSALAKKGATVFAMDRMPRTISRAQAFDAMSSALGLMGYKAVIEAATNFPRPLAGKMTMAGKIPPARVLVVGAAVAGLEAIATAKK